MYGISTASPIAPSPSIIGAVAIFAKCPIPGSSKTRLSVIVGDDGSAQLARAMLSDIILSLSKNKRLDNVAKFLVYGPGDNHGERIMVDLLSDLDIPFEMSEMIQCTDKESGDDGDGSFPKNQQQCPEITDCKKWLLLPMKTVQTYDKVFEKSDIDEVIKTNLRSSDLGSKLVDALTRIRTVLSRRSINDFYSIESPIVFLGMDAPEIPSDEIVQAIQIAQTKLVNSDDIQSHEGDASETNNRSRKLENKPLNKVVGKAYLNPAHDGGYGMLCVPPHAPSSIFEGVRWSSSLTAISQLKALTDHGVDVILGSLMNDIDEPDDLMNLAVRLCFKYSTSSSSSSKKLFSKNLDVINITNDIHVDRLSQCSEMFTAGNSEDEPEKNDDDKNNTTSCLYTFTALVNLGLVQKKERSTGTTKYVVSLNRFQVKEI